MAYLRNIHLGFIAWRFVSQRSNAQEPNRRCTIKPNSKKVRLTILVVIKLVPTPPPFLICLGNVLVREEALAIGVAQDAEQVDFGVFEAL